MSIKKSFLVIAIASFQRGSLDKKYYPIDYYYFLLAARNILRLERRMPYFDSASVNLGLTRVLGRPGGTMLSGLILPGLGNTY